MCSVFGPLSRRRCVLVALICLIATACQRAAEAPTEPVRIAAQVSPLVPRRVMFSPTEENRLIVVELSGLVEVWNVEDPEHPELIASAPASAIEAAFAPDGRAFVTVGTDGRVRFWNADGRLGWTSATGHQGPARAVAVRGDLVASGGEDGTIRLWRLSDGSAVGEPIAANEGPVVSVAISSQNQLASVGADDALHLWTPTAGAAPDAAPRYEGKILFQGPHRRPLGTFMSELRMDVHVGFDHSVEFSPKGDVVAAAVYDAALRIYGVDGSERGVATDAHQKRMLRGISFSPRGDLVASAGWDSTVRVWNLDATPHGPPIQAHIESAFSVSFSAQGDRLATTGLDNRVRLWSVEGLVVGELPEARKDRISAVAFAPQPVIAVADNLGTIRLWNVDGTVRGKPMVGHKGRIGSLAFSPRGDQLLSGGADRTVRLWSADGTSIGAFPPQGNEVPAVAFAPSGNLLVSGSDALRGWRANRMVFQSYSEGPGSWDFITAVSFSPKGDILISASRLGRIQVLNADGSPRTRSLKLPKENIRAVALSPDATFFATTGGDENFIRIWNLDLSPHGEPLTGHFGEINALAFSPYAAVLASGGQDGTVRLWKFPAAGEPEVLQVGVPVNQLGFWNELLWVRADGESIFFYDKTRRLVATTLLRRDAILTFTPDGWYAGPQHADRVLRAFRQSGEQVTGAELLKRFSPEKVRAALHG